MKADVSIADFPRLAPAETRYSWQLLRAGPLWLDGGGMFGVVPRVLWARKSPPDELGRIELAHNCLLLERPADYGRVSIVIETGSGNKFDAKMRSQFGLSDRSIIDAVEETGHRCEEINHVIVSHLHFDHASGLTRLDGGELRPTFPNSDVIVQRMEWEDAIENRAVMTRTYLRDHLDPIRQRVRPVESPSPFPRGYRPAREELPAGDLASRETEVLPGIRVFLVPGHTWGQQAIRFTDMHGQVVVFCPDVMPTVHHVGSAYNMAYDVEPFMSTVSRHWFLEEAVRRDWLLVLDHEPHTPLVRVKRDGKDWYELTGSEFRL
jgi:glyoxylase-like metal-dependent hydrolase (beta-lactamase superfamily II)